MGGSGYFTLFRVGGVPLRLHWTLPLGMVLLGGLRFAPGLWAGLLIVVALHEAGHALLVHRLGLVNLGVDLTGFGGRCRWAGDPSAIQRALIAWGGVLAQLALLVVSVVVLAIVGRPELRFLAELADAFTRANVVLIVINLIPLSPLDGAEAWPLIGHLWRDRARRRRWKRKLSERPQTLREALEEAERDARGR